MKRLFKLGSTNIGLILLLCTINNTRSLNLFEKHPTCVDYSPSFDLSEEEPEPPPFWTGALNTVLPISPFVGGLPTEGPRQSAKPLWGTGCSRL